MGGEIGAENRSEGGSRFWFEVVAGRASQPFSRRRPQPEHSDRAAAAGRHGRILLAEDNLVNVDLAKMILEGGGYTVDVVEDGAEAIDAVRRQRYDVVLMDVQMPNLDGLAAARQIRALEGAGPRTPIVAMTANALKEDRQRCFEAGMDDYFSKPFPPGALVEKVGQWINRTRPSTRPSADAIDGLTDLPVLDIGAADELRSSFTDERFMPMLRLYLEDLKQRTLLIERHNKNNEVEEVGRVAHKLIMASGAFGAKQVLALANRLQTAKQKDAGNVENLVDRFVLASAEAQAALRERYGVAA